uniref:Theileria-specific sub-telomeric protein, SVSP family member, putative n=1 Tax=Theileria annulata TaxID=5874 RepID=A0A3B0MZI2_THEAN
MYICFAYTYTLILLLIGYSGCSDKPTNTQGSNSNEDNFPKIVGLSLVDYSDSDEEDNFQVTETQEEQTEGIRETHEEHTQTHTEVLTETETHTEELDGTETEPVKDVETHTEPVKDVETQTDLEQPEPQKEHPRPIQPTRYYLIEPQFQYPGYHSIYYYPPYQTPTPYHPYGTQPTPQVEPQHYYSGYEYQPTQPYQPVPEYYPGPQYPVPIQQYPLPHPIQPYQQPQPPIPIPHPPIQGPYQQYQPQPGYQSGPYQSQVTQPTQPDESTQPTKEATTQTQTTKEPQQTTQHTQYTTEPSGLQPETIPVEIGSDEEEEPPEPPKGPTGPQGPGDGDQPEGAEGEGEDEELLCKEIKFLKKNAVGSLVELTKEECKIIINNIYKVKYHVTANVEQVLFEDKIIYEHRPEKPYFQTLVYNKKNNAFVVSRPYGFLLIKNISGEWVTKRARKIPEYLKFFRQGSVGREVEIHDRNYWVEFTTLEGFRFTFKKGVYCTKVQVANQVIWVKKIGEDHPYSVTFTAREKVIILFNGYIRIFSKGRGLYRHILTRSPQGYYQD